MNRGGPVVESLGERRPVRAINGTASGEWATPMHHLNATNSGTPMAEPHSRDGRDHFVL